MKLSEKMYEKVAVMLEHDEGVVKRGDRHVMYKDSEGIWTIGHGRNIQHKGISDEEANFLFKNDVNEAVEDCIKLIGEKDWYELGEEQQLAIINMMFNLGYNRFAQFKNTLDYIRKDEYEKAAKNALLSKWARQVKGRAVRVTELLKGKITGYKFK